MRGPIGIFDSGLGGLTVLKTIKRVIQGESIVYLGDTAHLPYGSKSKDTIWSLSLKNIDFLLKRKVKIIVVACNTASALCLEGLAKKYSLPLLGVIEPGTLRAIRATKNGRVGVIGTHSTIRSRAYEKSIKKYAPNLRVYSKACPLFVPLVEEGWAGSKVAENIADTYLRPLKNKKIDTLILGCTHYPLLKNAIKKVMGPRVTLVDSAEEIAAQVDRILEAWPKNATHSSRRRFCEIYVTDVPQPFSRLTKKILGNMSCRIKRVLIE